MSSPEQVNQTISVNKLARGHRYRDTNRRAKRSVKWPAFTRAVCWACRYGELHVAIATHRGDLISYSIVHVTPTWERSRHTAKKRIRMPRSAGVHLFRMSLSASKLDTATCSASMTVSSHQSKEPMRRRDKLVVLTRFTAQLTRNFSISVEGVPNRLLHKVHRHRECGRAGLR